MRTRTRRSFDHTTEVTIRIATPSAKLCRRCRDPYTRKAACWACHISGQHTSVVWVGRHMLGGHLVNHCKVAKCLCSSTTTKWPRAPYQGDKSVTHEWLPGLRKAGVRLPYMHLGRLRILSIPAEMIAPSHCCLLVTTPLPVSQGDHA